MEQKTIEKSSPTNPKWAIHISEVYRWAEQNRRYGGRLTKRTIQWYSTSGLIPSPERIGKEAYYNKGVIFCYLRSIEILNRRFGLLLNQIRKTIKKVESIEQVVGEVNDDGQAESVPAIVALSTLLEEYFEYEENEASQCESSMDGPIFSEEQAARLEKLQSEILKRLCGSKDTVQKLIEGGLINLEEELFPDGKMVLEEKVPVNQSSDEVPF